MKFVKFAVLALCIIFISCTTTLQQDVFQDSGLNQELADEIAVFEDRYILIDSDYLLKGVYEQNKVNKLHQDIEFQLSKPHLEPVIAAKITAIDGLLYVMEAKTKKAKDCYTSAKSIQAGDTYDLLLSTKFEKNHEENLKVCDEILSFDNDNAIILLEKGKLYYYTKQYDKSIAAIDDAFLIFDNQGRFSYRNAYREFRDSVWKLYSSGMDYSTTESLNSILTKESMVLLTMENTKLLEDITAGSKFKTNELLKKLDAAHIFSSARDSDNKNNSSSLILLSKKISRVMCARYLWNLYVFSKGNSQLLTKYSRRYDKMLNAKSPVPDIQISDEDFDAVLGTVENEIMSLPDGKNFNPTDEVSVLDFLTYLNALK